MVTKLTPDETMQIGEKLYLERIQSHVEPQYIGQYIAIDVVSGDYVVSENSVEATDKIHEVHPNAVVALMRVGYETAAAMGGRLRRRDDTRAA